MLSRLFRPSASKRAAEALYAATVAQARTPAFFERLGAPDTVEGRFDVLVLHVHLLLRRLRGEGEAASSVGQLLFDVMFKDMDASLREMGVGDLVISKRMQKLVSAFYGRAARYDEALDADGPQVLEEALALNICGQAEGRAPEWADYVRRQSEALAAQSLEDILSGDVRFEPAATPAEVAP